MALTIVDNRLILNECDATTSWTATDGPTVFTTAPAPIESNGCLALQASNAVEDAYVAITSDNFLSGTLSIWIQDRAEFELTTNVGIGMQVGDGTNRVAYAIGGSDGTAFRHDTGPVKWANFLLDLSNKPANFIVLGGVEANLDETAITQVGLYVETIVKSVGGADNVFWDILRFADIGVGIETYGGTTGARETFAALAELDRSVGDQQAYGLIRELATKVYGIQGNINLGDATTASGTYFDIVSDTVAFENRGLSAANYYRFTVSGNPTGDTNVFFNAANMTVSEGASASCNFADDNSNVSGTSTVFAGFDQGINLGGKLSTWTANSFNSCGIVETTGVDLSNSVFSEANVASGDPALYWNTTVDTDGRLDGCSFTKGTGDNHAIQFPSSLTGGSVTLNNTDFNGYNASNNLPDSTFNVLGTTGTLTINLVGSAGNASYNTAGTVVTLVVDPVDMLVTALDSRDATPISGARVLVEASDGSGDLPYQDSVTISVSSGTATVTHATHGMSEGDKVRIEGATEADLNGVKTISNVAAGSYDYSTTAGDGAAGGTILATGVVIDGNTDVSGEITDTRTWGNPQPITGKVRKSTTSPYFKTAALAGTISTTAGLASTVQLIIDE